jgi:hypothetical protein
MKLPIAFCNFQCGIELAIAVKLVLEFVAFRIGEEHRFRLGHFEFFAL